MKLRKQAMSAILKFTSFSLRDLLVTAGPTLLVIGLVCGVAYWLVDPSPPSHITISTGQENSAYEEFGKKYAKVLARQHIKATLKPSLGSQENLQRLTAPGSQIDIAFVQSGSTEQAEAERKGLLSLGSLFTEPVWLFYRESKNIARLTQLKGLKINVGPEGSGVPRLFKQLLSVNGVEDSDLILGRLENTPATVALLDGSIDGLVFSSAPDAPLIQMLLQTPGIKLFDFTQAEAYSRRFPFLSHVVLPRGIVDLGRDLPSKDYHLIAPTATLVEAEAAHEPLRVVGDEGGTPTYAADVADGIVELLAEDAHGGIHHLVNGLTATRALWAEYIVGRFRPRRGRRHVPATTWPRASSPPRWGVLAATPMPSGEPLRPWPDAMADYAPTLARRHASAR